MAREKLASNYPYFILCYIAYSAFTLDFAIRGTIGPQLLEAFHLNNQQLGVYYGSAFWGVAIGSAVLGWLVDLIGYKASFITSFILQISGILLLFFTYNTSPEYVGAQLLASMLLMGLGEGGIFAVIHPFIAILFDDPVYGRTRIMNLMHTNWPLFILVGALITNLFQAFNFSWRAEVAVLCIFPVLYFIAALILPFPTPPTRQKADSAEEMKVLIHPGYLILLLCMVTIAAVELGPQEWITTLMQQKLLVNGLMFLIFAEVIQGVFRLFGGSFAHRVTPFGLLAIGALFASIGLMLFSISVTVWMGLLAAFIFGVGIAWFWPTLLAAVADLYPKGGSFALGLMNCFGFISVAQVLPYIGQLSHDFGPSIAFRFLSFMALGICIVFVFLLYYFRKNYKVKKTDVA